VWTVDPEDAGTMILQKVGSCLPLNMAWRPKRHESPGTPPEDTNLRQHSQKINLQQLHMKARISGAAFRRHESLATLRVDESPATPQENMNLQQRHQQIRISSNATNSYESPATPPSESPISHIMTLLLVPISSTTRYALFV